MSGDAREQAILATAERLLEISPLRELTIEDLAAGAGISRSQFYFYFASKEAVLFSLLDRLTSEADRAREEAIAQVEGGSIEDLCRAGITAFHDTFRAHRAVTLAAADARASNPEVHALWSRVMEGWIDATAAQIALARPRTSAVAARDLSIVLNLMNERALHATFAGETPAVAEADVVEALVAVWLGAIGTRNQGDDG